MKSRSPTFKDLPLDIVGSSVFGRYPKISVEQTFNMLISDEWLVGYAGYQNVLALNPNNPVPNPLNPSGVGRGAYHSTRLNRVIVVVFNAVYSLEVTIPPSGPPIIVSSFIGTIGTTAGDVFIAEDIQGHIAICDKHQIYIWDTIGNTFLPATINGTTPLDFTPGYVAFHNGRFITVDIGTSTPTQWRLSDPAQGNSVFPSTTQFTGGFQTKADRPVAALPFPGKGNMIMVMGSIVTEIWTDVGAALFPYQRSTGTNIDYGCLNADTIATLDNYTCWVAGNDRSGPAILVSTGGLPERISTDGIDFVLATLSAPQDSHGFMFRQDGHIIYQVVFPTDNVSYAYDFTTKRFFTVTDENMNYHPAKKAVYVTNTYFFISLNDGNFYQFDSSVTNINYGYNAQHALSIFEIPRVRVCRTVRLPDTAPFITNNLTFPIEMGIADATTFPPSTTPRVDLSVSRDGGYNFSNFDSMNLNPIGDYKNRFIYYGLGWGNEITPQFRFWGLGRFVCGNGTLSIYQ